MNVRLVRELTAWSILEAMAEGLTTNTISTATANTIQTIPPHIRVNRRRTRPNQTAVATPIRIMAPRRYLSIPSHMLCVTESRGSLSGARMPGFVAHW